MAEERTKPKFDADLPPTHEVNLKAAKARGLRYSFVMQAYLDSDGLKIRDKFGQPL